MIRVRVTPIKGQILERLKKDLRQEQKEKMMIDKIAKQFAESGLPLENLDVYTSGFYAALKTTKKRSRKKMVRKIINNLDYPESQKQEIALKCSGISKEKYDLLLAKEQEKTGAAEAKKN